MLKVKDLIQYLQKADPEAIVAVEARANNMASVVAQFDKPSKVVYIADDISYVDDDMPGVATILSPWTVCPSCEMGYNPEDNTEYDTDNNTEYYVCPYCGCAQDK